MYQIDGLLKFIEEDNYQEGCNPSTAQSWHIDMKFTGATIDEVIKKVQGFLNVDDDGTERNACDEKRRIDFQPQANKRWKHGNAEKSSYTMQFIAPILKKWRASEHKHLLSIPPRNFHAESISQALPTT